MNGHRLRNIGLGILMALGLTVGCSAGDNAQKESAPQVDVLGVAPPIPASSDLGERTDFGMWRMHWSPKTGATWTPVDRAAESSGIRPKGFIPVPHEAAPPAVASKVNLILDNAIGYNTSCSPAEHDPTYGIYVTSAPPVYHGYAVPNGHVAQWVQLENKTNRTIDNVQFEGLYWEDGSGLPSAGYASASSTPVPTGYPVSSALGLWAFGDIPSGNVSERVLTWTMPTCSEEYYLFVRISGTLRRTSYAVATTTEARTAFLDACSLPGASSVLQNQGPNVATASIPMPFPFTLWDVTFDTDDFPFLKLSSNGALGFTKITRVRDTIPSTNYPYTMFPFWDRLKLGPSGICYAVTGTAPNRKFVATWKNADLPSTTTAQENMTFSAVLSEGTDLIEFVYDEWADTQAPCTATQLLNRGSGATVALQGGTGTQYALSSTTNFLPQRSVSRTGSCTSGIAPAFDVKVTFTPSPGNASL